jgi:hypothetical protein
MALTTRAAVNHPRAVLWDEVMTPKGVMIGNELEEIHVREIDIRFDAIEMML